MNEGNVGLVNIALGTEVASIQDVEPTNHVGFAGIDVPDEGLSFILVLGNNQIPHIPVHEKNVGGNLIDGPAHRERMFVESFGPELEPIRPDPRQGGQHDRQQKDDAHADLELRPDSHIPELHLFPLASYRFR